MTVEAATPAANALARFFRAVSGAALELADALENLETSPTVRSLDTAGLGSLQRQVVDVPEMNSDVGISPREITRHLDRGDEPNVRNALAALQKRGVAELVPGPGPQRWRLTAQYRSE